MNQNCSNFYSKNSNEWKKISTRNVFNQSIYFLNKENFREFYFKILDADVEFSCIKFQIWELNFSCRNTYVEFYTYLYLGSSMYQESINIWTNFDQSDKK